MKHIYDHKSGDINFDRYAAYLESVRDELPKHVYAFASDSRHFDLHSKSTLHDAWLESFNVREPSSGERHEIRNIEIHMRLLGPFHDRFINLKYFGVSKYEIHTPSKPGEPRFTHTGHGDLLTHEVRVENGALVHELLFERDATFVIECVDIQHSEESIAV